MDRPSLLSMDTQFLYYLRSPSRDRIEVYDFVDWHEIITTDTGDSFRPRCRYLAGADRVLSQFYGGSKPDTGQGSRSPVDGYKPPTYELYYNRLQRIWYFLEPEGSRDGGCTGFVVGWSARSLGEAHEDFRQRRNSESMDQYCSVYYAILDSGKLPGLYDWRWIYE